MVRSLDRWQLARDIEWVVRQIDVHLAKISVGVFLATVAVLILLAAPLYLVTTYGD